MLSPLFRPCPGRSSTCKPVTGLALKPSCRRASTMKCQPHFHPASDLVVNCLSFLSTPFLRELEALEKQRKATTLVPSEKRSIHHHCGNPPFFQFLGLYDVYPFGPMVKTFPLFSEGMVYTIDFLLCDLWVGRQTERGGVPR